MKNNDETSLIPAEKIVMRIIILREEKIILDKDIAELYGVQPIALRQQVKRNIKRFPPDFMFQLSKEEAHILVSQNVIPSQRSLGGSLPYAFTEHGAAMLASVLKSDRAIAVSIQIVRTFIKLRKLIATNEALRLKIEEMEKKYDKNFAAVFDTLKLLIAEEAKPKRQIGFS